MSSTAASAWGGALTAEGTLEVAEAMNHARDIQQNVALLLESAEADLPGKLRGTALPQNLASTK